MSLCVRDEEQERGIALIQRNGSNGEKREDGAVASNEAEGEYDPHLYRNTLHPTS